ncbi:MAG: hypothetical protein HQ581_11885 [Planctomycetes bacterium]|nr:hypothetical protein [Planctomycetota bacterium]
MKETERCPECSQEMAIPPELSGKLVQCPNCRSQFPTARRSPAIRIAPAATLQGGVASRLRKRRQKNVGLTVLIAALTTVIIGACLAFLLLGANRKDDAERVLCDALDSWIMGERMSRYSENNPEIDYLVMYAWISSTKLLRYKITAYKYNENRSALDSPTQKADVHTFAVTLIFQSEANTELVVGRTVEVYQLPEGKWVVKEVPE